MSWFTALYRRVSPEPHDWGLTNNDLDFTAQLVPNGPGILTAVSQGVALSPAQVRTEGRPGMVVRISGVVQAGPDGPVDGPLSGMTCAWFRSYVTTIRHSMPIVGGSGVRPLSDLAPSDFLGFNHGGSKLRKGLRDSAQISSTQFRVGDRDGFVDIDPRFASVDTDVMACNTVQHPNRVDDCLLVEWVLPLAQRVTVFGTLGPDLTLLPGPDAALLVSTKSEQNVLARRRVEARHYEARGRKLERVRRGRADRVNRAIRSGTIALGVAAFVAVVVLILIAASGGF